MTVRTFAERILFGAHLEDKLARIEDPNDTDPGPAIDVPDAPARPRQLAFPSGGERAPFEFPTPKQLENDALRGKALHFFGNHELLALELMALMLLRFPDAPPTFRSNLVRTIGDEQKHLELYRRRMNALGVELGDVAVNDYFWRVMKDARSPLEFVVAMSLTFEQANLDFTRHYADRIRQIGDAETAAVLDIVYADEIRHVHHGVEWLERWRDPGEDDWSSYRRLLAPPLSPARAKGPSFDADGRRKAGLSERFIRELSLFTKSKGRTPAVLIFEAGCEDAIAQGPRYTPPQAVLDVEHDLAPLMMFLAAGDDVVLMPERPSAAHLDQLARAGFAIPELRTFAEGLDGPAARTIGWGSSPRSRDRAASLGLTLDPSPPEVHSKLFALELRRQVFALPEVAPLILPDAEGAIASGAEETLRAAEAIFARGFARAVAKAPYSSSGRHRTYLSSATGSRSGEAGAPGHSVRCAPSACTAEPLTPDQVRWLEQRTVLVEPWLDRVCDLSLSIDVRPNSVERISFDRFLTDDRGRYRGHVLGPPLAGLDLPLEPMFRRADPFAALNAIARLTAEHLRAAGYLGPAGIDMLLHLREGVVYWQPVIEVNPRLTMGFIARALARLIAPGSFGVWRHSPIRELAGLTPSLELGPRGIIRGVIPTNDLSQARAIGTVLHVARSSA